MKWSGDSRPVLVRRCTPVLILAVGLGEFLIAAQTAVAQGNGTTPAASSLLTDRLIVLNLPHPRGLIRELASNPQQQRNSQYAREFQKPDAAKKVTVDALSSWVKDPEARKVYREALARSSMEGMLNYNDRNCCQSANDGTWEQ